MGIRIEDGEAYPGGRAPRQGGPEAPAECRRNRRPIRGLLFDKDGTLFDFHGTWSAWSQALIVELAGGDAGRMRRLARALGFDLERGRFVKSSPVIAGTLEVVVDAVLRVLPETRPEALRAHLIRSAAAVRPVEAAPLAPLLGRLRDEGYALGVATNDAEAAARAQLAPVIDLLDFLAGYDSGFGAKPGPGMARAFCRHVGLAPEQVAMVGDSTHDLECGQAAGLVTIGVLTGPADAADLAPHADAVVEHVGALPDWLAGRV
jgi:phosphoglycolate phosphatase